MISDPVIALLVGLCVLVVFTGIVLAGRRPPRAPQEVATETWRRSVEGRLGHVENQLDLTQSDVKKTKHDVGNIRMAMQYMPTAKDIYEIQNKVAEMSGEMKGLNASLGSLHAGLGRIESFMMEVSAKRIVGIKADEGAKP